MNRLDLIKQLNGMLLAEMPDYRDEARRFGMNELEQRKLLRSLMNVRKPKELNGAFVELQDELLSAEREEKGVVDVASIPFAEPHIKLWRGDITRLNADAIVNAANSALLGCFVPCHRCIDNAIHSAAGLQLREECAEIMSKQKGHYEPTGKAKITHAYNLPSRFVIHTVGPIINGPLTQRDRDMLAGCYRSCLELAAENGLKSVAFCCISTGEFRFPNDSAAEIAVDTVRRFTENSPDTEVIFNVFKEYDERIYRQLLGQLQTS